uniref:Uncharacterized protein n=1 Tax=Romanomermis culicivorax TaxID=13658 RepID=A0A915KVG6_ROMCU
MIIDYLLQVAEPAPISSLDDETVDVASSKSAPNPPSSSSSSKSTSPSSGIVPGVINGDLWSCCQVLQRSRGCGSMSSSIRVVGVGGGKSVGAAHPPQL